MTNKEIIKIEQENKTEAEFMSRNFVDKVTKNRAYVNALGAELVVKYLVENGIEVGELHNIHSVSKILEKIDISDILLSNIHIDVRVVFDEENIFIPKSHFDLDINPDIYVFAKLNSDFESVELLGYLESGKVDLEKSNKDYYFVDKGDLESVNTLINYVKNFSRNRDKSLSDTELLKGRELSVSMADHDISDSDFKKLLSMLLVSDSLRNSLLEFDNFELLSYNAVAFVPEEPISEEDTAEEVVDTAPIAGSALVEEVEGQTTDSEPVEDITEQTDEVVAEDDAYEYETFDTQEESLPFEEEEDKVTADELQEAEITDISEDSDAISAFEEDFQTFGEEDKINEISDIIEEEIVSEPEAEDIFDGDILSEDLGETPVSEVVQDIDITGSNGANKKDSDNKNIGGAIASGAAAIAGAAGTVSAIGAAGATAATGATAAATGAGAAMAAGAAEVVGMGAAAVTDEAIKLAGMADGVSEKVSENIENLSEDLPDISFGSSDVELSEEIFDGDDTIAGIGDFDNGTEGITLPELSDDNISGVELPAGDDASNNGFDDIFADFAQDAGTNSQPGGATPEPSSENMMSFADLEQVNQAPVSSTSELADFSEFEISEGAPSNSSVYENSTVISDKTFSVGEIPIDINNNSASQGPIQGELEDIYNPDNANNSSMLNNNVRIIKNNPEQNKKNPFMVILIVLALLAALAFGAYKFMKPAEPSEPVVDDYVPETTPDVVPEDPNALSVDKNNVVDMDKSMQSVIPSGGAGIIRQSKPIASTAYLKVSKISWEVPDYVSYSPAFRQYFQSAGRSLKLALTSDLLLASEYPYSNQVRVSATFNRSGGFTDARMVQSSGSAEIDKIVLQTVNQTLKVLNAPASLRDDDNTTVILKIYF